MSVPTNAWPHGLCVFCGKDGELEPRFLYFACKEHEDTPPVTGACFVHSDVRKDALDTYLRDLVAGKETTDVS